MGSLWPSVITAVAVLVGVVTGHLMQGRREERRWDRERQRDADQRADLRERDRELWAREDQHRFVETKRVIYADYLRQLGELEQVLEYTAKSLKEVLPNADEASTSFDTALLYHGAGIDDQVVQQGRAVAKIRYDLQLIAPEVVSTVAELANAKYLLAITKALGGKVDEFESERAAFRDTRTRLVRLMRKDIGLGSSTQFGANGPRLEG